MYEYLRKPKEYIFIKIGNKLGGGDFCPIPDKSNKQFLIVTTSKVAHNNNAQYM